MPTATQWSWSHADSSRFQACIACSFAASGLRDFARRALVAAWAAEQFRTRGARSSAKRSRRGRATPDVESCRWRCSSDGGVLSGARGFPANAPAAHDSRALLARTREVTRRRGIEGLSGLEPRTRYAGHAPVLCSSVEECRDTRIPYPLPEKFTYLHYGRGAAGERFLALGT
jgi:hypothetical protein